MTVYGLLSLLMLGLVVGASFASTRPRASAVAIGAIVAALCLVKINVGAFAALAVVFAWAGGLAPRWRRFALPALGVVITVAPLVLMANLLARAWVLEFALVASMSAAAVSLAWILAPPPKVTSPSSAWLIVGGVTAPGLGGTTRISPRGCSYRGWPSSRASTRIRSPARNSRSRRSS